MPQSTLKVKYSSAQNKLQTTLGVWVDQVKVTLLNSYHRRSLFSSCELATVHGKFSQSLRLVLHISSRAQIRPWR